MSDRCNRHDSALVAGVCYVCENWSGPSKWKWPDGDELRLRGAVPVKQEPPNVDELKAICDRQYQALRLKANQQDFAPAAVPPPPPSVPRVKFILHGELPGGPTLDCECGSKWRLGTTTSTWKEGSKDLVIGYARSGQCENCGAVHVGAMVSSIDPHRAAEGAARAYIERLEENIRRLEIERTAHFREQMEFADKAGERDAHFQRENGALRNEVTQLRAELGRVTMELRAGRRGGK